MRSVLEKMGKFSFLIIKFFVKFLQLTIFCFIAPVRTKAYNARLARFKQRLLNGEFHPTMNIALTLDSNSYYDAIEKIVMKQAAGCKHCMNPLLKDEERLKLKAEFRVFMRVRPNCLSFFLHLHLERLFSPVGIKIYSLPLSEGCVVQMSYECYSHDREQQLHKPAMQ